jgi:hypothetical protein
MTCVDLFLGNILLFPDTVELFIVNVLSFPDTVQLFPYLHYVVLYTYPAYKVKKKSKAIPVTGCEGP